MRFWKRKREGERGKEERKERRFFVSPRSFFFFLSLFLSFSLLLSLPSSSLSSPPLPPLLPLPLPPSLTRPAHLQRRALREVALHHDRVVAGGRGCHCARRRPLRRGQQRRAAARPEQRRKGLPAARRAENEENTKGQQIHGNPKQKRGTLALSRFRSVAFASDEKREGDEGRRVSTRERESALQAERGSTKKKERRRAREGGQANCRR